MDDEVETEEIVLLEEYGDCLLGCVYDEEGAPVPVYSSEGVVNKLMDGGMSEPEAVEYVNFETDGMRLMWVHPIELDVQFEPDPKPHLRLVH